MGRREAGHTAAFLVDQDRRIAAAGDAAEIAGQGAHLVGALAVAGEQDETEGIGLLDQGTFALAKRCSLDPEYACLGHGGDALALDHQAALFAGLELGAHLLRRRTVMERTRP